MTEQTPITPDPAQNVTPAPVAQPAASASNVPSQAAGAQPSEPQKPKGLDAIIGHAYDEHDPDKPAETDNARPRDPVTKRFVAKNPTPEASATGASEGEVTPAVDANAKPAAVQPLEPNARWSEPQKAMFSALPREAQQFLLDRSNETEADYSRKTQEIAETRKQFEPLAQALQPFQGYFQQIGQNPHQAIPELIRAEATLRFGTPEQKLTFFARLANDYGINLAAFAGNGQSGQPAYDPAKQQSADELASLRREVLAIRQEREQADLSAASSQIQAFAAEKDSAGQPKYPFYETVKGRMGQIIQEGKAATLHDAYEQAAAPIKAAMAEDLKRQQAAIAEQQKAALEKARNAAPVRTSGAPNGHTTAKGLDAILRQSISRAGIN